MAARPKPGEPIVPWTSRFPLGCCRCANFVIPAFAGMTTFSFEGEWLRATSELELDPLRQRQRIRIVDRIRLPAHIRLPRIRAGFTATAGFLLAAERAADFCAAGADVDVGDAAVGTSRREIGFRRLHGLR